MAVANPHSQERGSRTAAAVPSAVVPDLLGFDRDLGRDRPSVSEGSGLRIRSAGNSGSLP